MKFSRVALSLAGVFLFLNSYPALAAKVGTVSGDSVPLYSNPDSGSSSNATMLNGDVVTISNFPTKGFYKARTETGQTGWIEAGSLLVGEESTGQVDSATLPAAPPGRSTPAAPGAVQVITPPANQNPQSADNLVPAPPSTPAPISQPAQTIAEVPPAPTAARPLPTGGATNPPPLPSALPAAPVISATSNEVPAPAPTAEAPPPTPDETAAPTEALPEHGGSSTFTYEDVQPSVSYEVEAHRNGPRPVVHTYSGRKPYTIYTFVGGDKVSMTDFNNLVGAQAFTSALYVGGEFGYAVTDEVKFIFRAEYLTKSSNGGTADLSLSTIPVSLGVGLQIGRWKYVHFYASGLFGVAFNTQVTATASNLPAPNQTQLQENTFTEMVKIDASVPIYKAFGAFAEGGYRFLKTSSLTPSTQANGTSVFQVNGENTPTPLDLSGPFFGAGVSFQF